MIRTMQQLNFNLLTEFSAFATADLASEIKRHLERFQSPYGVFGFCNYENKVLNMADNEHGHFNLLTEFSAFATPLLFRIVLQM